MPRVLVPSKFMDRPSSSTNSRRSSIPIALNNCNKENESRAQDLLPEAEIFRKKYHDLMKKNQSLVKENSRLHLKCSALERENQNSLALYNPIDMIMSSAVPRIQADLMAVKAPLDHVINELSNISHKLSQLSLVQESNEEERRMSLTQDQVMCHRSAAFERIRTHHTETSNLSTILEVSRMSSSGKRSSSITRMSITHESVTNPISHAQSSPVIEMPPSPILEVEPEIVTEVKNKKSKSRTFSSRGRSNKSKSATVTKNEPVVPNGGGDRLDMNPIKDVYDFVDEEEIQDKDQIQDIDQGMIVAAKKQSRRKPKNKSTTVTFVTDDVIKPGDGEKENLEPEDEKKEEEKKGEDEQEKEVKKEETKPRRTLRPRKPALKYME